MQGVPIKKDALGIDVLLSGSQKALSLPPEQVVMERYTGDQPLRHDLFPTLRSLQDSDEAKNFSRLAVSPNGADALASHARSYEDAQQGRGWIEVKLNSYGFARDKSGRMMQLYRTKDDFAAQWKAFDKADEDLAAARRTLGAAADPKKNIAGSGVAAEEASVRSDVDAKQAAYDAAPPTMDEADPPRLGFLRLGQHDLRLGQPAVCDFGAEVIGHEVVEIGACPDGPAVTCAEVGLILDGQGEQWHACGGIDTADVVGKVAGVGFVI